MYPACGPDFVQCIYANSRPRIPIRELNEELLTFCKAQPRRFLSLIFSGIVDIDNRFQKFVLFSLNKLLNKHTQDTLRLPAISSTQLQ